MMLPPDLAPNQVRARARAFAMRMMRTSQTPAETLRALESATVLRRTYAPALNTTPAELAAELVGWLACHYGPLIRDRETYIEAAASAQLCNVLLVPVPPEIRQARDEALTRLAELTGVPEQWLGEKLWNLQGERFVQMREEFLATADETTLRAVIDPKNIRR
ncbi:hypothetical protein [Streptosporangium sp. CA-115845]|uniref:hypothetical protein n=1 Tax=Streptosporangium sp. CA-115845 TaxID=3240071 RepID=UPI003D8B0534